METVLCSGIDSRKVRKSESQKVRKSESQKVRKSESQKVRKESKMKLLLIGFGFAAFLIFTQVGCTPTTEPESSKCFDCHLFVPNTPIRLGRVAARSCFDVPVRLKNSTRDRVSISRIQTSCHCFSIVNSSPCFEPQSSQDILLRVDLSQDPDCRGGLMLSAKGWTSTGEPAFDICVEIDVVSPAELGLPEPNVAN